MENDRNYDIPCAFPCARARTTVRRFMIPVRRLLAAFAVACLGLGVPAAHAATYTIDPDHSTVGFRIRHLLSYVYGTFDQFEGVIEYEPGKPETWKAEATIQAARVNTRVEQRDKHLRTKEFFDVEQFPTITFTSIEVTDVADDHAKLHGTLTLHGVARPVVLDLAIHGVAKDPWGNVRAGFTGTTAVDRKEFGLTWNQALETGGVLVGDQVDLTLEIEAIQAEQ